MGGRQTALARAHSKSEVLNPVTEETSTREPYVQRYLDCSTNHLPWSERSSLDGGTPHYLCSDEYSDFVYVGEDDRWDPDVDVWADYPYLRGIIHRARELDCKLVRLDVDGCYVHGLPTFEGQQGNSDHDLPGPDPEGE